MKTLFMRHVIAIFSLLLFYVNFTYAQTFECDTESLTDQEYQDFLDDISAGAGTIRGSVNYEIPIHAFIINDDNGNPPSIGFDLANIPEALDVVNSFFTNGMSFYLCDITSINNSTYTTESNLAALHNFIHVQLGYDIDAVTLVINSAGAADAGQLPTQGNVIRMGGSHFSDENGESGPQFAHELGHYFGLRHTHINTVTYNPITQDFRPIYLPDCSCNPEEMSLCNCPNQTCGCDNTGDFIADTSVDPIYESGNNFFYFFCSPATTPSPCVISTPGGQVLNYYPPYENIMSYYNSTWEGFSPLQLERMVESLDHPARVFLKDSAEPVCTDFVNFPIDGAVDRIRYNTSTSTWEADPLPDATMNIRNNYASSSSFSLDCEDITDLNGGYSVESCLGTITSIDVTAGQVESANTNGIFAANNGVTVLDIAQIEKHILSTVLLPKPYAWIAADVNNSGTISVLDINKIRSVILGIDVTFDIPSWRFLPRYYLDNQWNFNTNFDSNPFTAVLDWQDGTDRGYLVNGNNPSYLDDVDITNISTDLEDVVNWSFYGIKTGDVNASANITSSSMLALASIQNNNLEVAPHTTIPAGTTFTILVESKTDKPILAYQFGLRFDPNLFEVLGTNQGDIKDFTLDNFGLQKTQQGEFRTLWVDKEVRGITFAGKKTLFKVYCKAKRNIEDISRSINLDDEVLKCSFYDNRDNLTEGNISLRIMSEEVKAYLLGVYPNPTSNELNFKLKLTKPATIAITVRDKNGRTVSHNSNYQVGEFTPSFQNISALATGVLTYTVSVDGKTLYSGQVIKL